MFAYNFSFDSEQSDDAGKRWGPSNDISIHGHYPYATLFEGNIVQRAGVGDYWGPGGPRMTLFRNRIAAAEKDYDLAHYRQLGIPPLRMTIYLKDHSHGINVIGNTLTDDAGLTVDDTCRDALVEGNLIAGKMVWNQAKPVALPPSLFLKDRPWFWGERPWPCIGEDVDAQRFAPLPAQDWYGRIQKAGHAVPFAARKADDATAESPLPFERENSELATNTGEFNAF